MPNFRDFNTPNATLMISLYNKSGCTWIRKKTITFPLQYVEFVINIFYHSHFKYVLRQLCHRGTQQTIIEYFVVLSWVSTFEEWISNKWNWTSSGYLKLFPAYIKCVKFNISFWRCVKWENTLHPILRGTFLYIPVEHFF